jgi:hypothetical protein
MKKDPAAVVKAGKLKQEKPVAVETSQPSRVGLDTSDHALAALLTRLRFATDLADVRILSEKIERVIFHKQFESA